ncbi:DUF3168 domain-containing protein [Aliihoeflea aestuarii]|jgi:hypothetical protein|uniref:DUF3168 domain-containing protein n=1 Tax=Aliihoeflea aestuarii TaxID=453840 RepID=UPI0020923671|nr:DUF3168 domain-containing protein [Aliihoeflea aestuarii]MCO6390557.1 DUF3168 domain-containing protein [Aliihoeflea aestuarii]
MSAALAVQKAIRARLSSTVGVTSLVPVANILDRNALPAPDPSIIIGEDQAVEHGDIARRGELIFSTLHIWKRELGLTGAKAIASAIRTAIHAERLHDAGGYHIADCRVSSMRFLRDPDGETAHGIVTIETLVMEVA